MKNKYKFKIFIILCLLISLVSCKTDNNGILSISTSITHDEKFGGFYSANIEEFNTLGFEYGDAVDLVFSNGTEIKDIPYYNGFYTKTNKILLCAYPGYERVKICRNNGEDLYIELNLNEDIELQITLNQKAKYIDVQNAMDTVYKNERDAFETDEIFANYRMMKGGNLKEGIFYRSASPIDNEYNRAYYANKLVEKDGIKYILNLSDNEEELENFVNDDTLGLDYTKELYRQGKIIALSMGVSFITDSFKEKVKLGFEALLENEGPYLIHCVEGKDRTGFIAILIESLCGATYDELLEDYMITYNNYYQINKNNKSNQYNAIVDIKFDDMVYYLAGANSKEEIKNIDMSLKAKEYLLSAGMREEDITKLIDILTN